MSSDGDKVRFSHAGHDFHFLWTARRSLNLLNPLSDLVGVSIEGISSSETYEEDKSILSIDTAEYYTSEEPNECTSIQYHQLKYSTQNQPKIWISSEISIRKEGVAKGVIVSFASSFKENIDKYGLELVLARFSYNFVTNRPIDENIKKLIRLRKENKLFKVYQLYTKEIDKIYNRFLEDSNLSKIEFYNFLLTLNFIDNQESRYEQKQQLQLEVNSLVPTFDINISIILKELIQSRAMPEYENDPVIRKETIFHAFGITKIEDLLPAQPSFNIVDNYIEREQESDIAKQILESDTPVVIHASGGVGKSSFAQNLFKLMPNNSKCVIFDGFANGAYRSPKDQRHLHKNGLIQIVNEFSIQGLCLPMLPKDVSSDDLLKAFYNRLEQIILEVRDNDKNSVVLIILDAADNTQTAAVEYGLQSSFTNDLLQIPLPNGCKIVALSRTERLNILNLKENILKIELNSMSQEETKQYLLTQFNTVLKKDVDAFHKFTFGNPRVQSYLIDSGRSLSQIITLLGHKGLSCEDLIESQIEQHLASLLEEHAYSKEEIELLCKSLAILPPMVPIDILAKASNIDKSLITSFASDLGLALFIKDENNSVQFRDEPVETWFRKTFLATKDVYELMANRLIDLKDSNPYVAITIPRLLYGAERYDDLYKNAYSNQLNITDPIQQQTIVVENLAYSIKIANQQKDYLNLNKLLLELSKVLSIKDRSLEFIFDNADIIATLAGSEFINDFLYREKQIDRAGILYASSALMLSMNPIYHAEARIFLRLTEEFLKEWIHYSEHKRNENRIENQDRANITLAYLYTDGVEEAVYQLNRWLNDSVKLKSMKIVIQHLVEHQEIDLIDELLLYTSSKNINMLFAIIVKLHYFKLPISKEVTLIALRTLTKLKTKTDDPVVITVLQLALQHNFCKKSLLKLLDRYLPKGEIHKFSYNYKNRDTYFLLYYSIYKLLKNEPLEEKDFLKKDAEKSQQYFIKILFPLYKLHSEILIQKSELHKEDCIAKIKETLSKSSIDEWRFENNHNLRDTPYLIAYKIIDNLLLIDDIEHYQIVIEYLKKRKNSIPSYVWINISKKIFYKDKSIALRFIQEAYQTIISNKTTSYDSSSFIELARAVLPISKGEAQAYFELALEANLNLGDDARNRLHLLCDITNKLDKNNNCPKSAYEFLRVSELVYHFDGHKFQWSSIINSIYNIDITSSLAISSRLKDRDIVSFYESLPDILNNLLHDDCISPQSFTSMIILTENYGYGFYESIKCLSKKVTDNVLFENLSSRTINNMFLENNEIDSYYIKKVQSIFNDRGIKNDYLEHYIKYNKDNSYSSDFVSKENITDWNKILKDFDFLTIDNIHQAYAHFRENTQYIDHGYFFEEMRKRIPFEKRIENLNCFVQCDYNINTIINEIVRCNDEWKDSLSIQKYIPKVIENIFNNESKDILNNYGLKNILDTGVKLTGKSRIYLIEILLKEGLESIQSQHYETILRLIYEFKNHIDSKKTKELLAFGIEQFQDDLEDDISDGIWCDKLSPLDNISDSLGGFIYTALGSTKTEDRWRAMYTVRMLCELGESETLTSIAQQLEKYNGSFNDQQFKFYDLHAKLYFFIALSRGVLENAKVLQPFFKLFKYYALDWHPHALIRKYCIDIALEIEKQFPNTYSKKELNEFEQKKDSKFSREVIVSADRYSRKTIEPKLERKNRLRFGHDWEPCWFDYIAKAFNINVSDISQMIENLILDEWGYDEKFEYWDYDLRAKYNIFENDMKTDIYKYDYPKQDRLSFYIIYHAMLCIAGELFDNNSVFYDEEYEDDLWENWLSRHTLTRKDNKWVSDRKDFMPIDLYRDDKELLKHDNWQFSVTQDDFDNVLNFKEKNLKFLPIYGSWKYGSEKISIESVFVSENNSHALLRALQTVENPRDFYLAPDQDRRCVKKDQFQMFGVIEQNDSLELKLDQFDSLAKIRYPGLKPSNYLIKEFNLEPDSEDKIWKHNRDDVFISETWDDWYSGRLQINYEHLLSMLSVMEKDLLVNVEIEREKESYHESYDADKIYYPPYFKLFIFKKDGTVHELYKSYKIR